MVFKAKKRLSKFIFLIGLLITCSSIGYAQNTLISEMDKLKWEYVMPGIWKATVGKIGLNALDYSDPPKVEAIKELGESPFPFSKAESYSQVTPYRASIRLPLDESEKIYGLGLEFDGINRRGDVYTLKVDHYGGTKGYTHAPVPFYISSKGYGVLINSSQRVKIHVGVGNRKDSERLEQIPLFVKDGSIIPMTATIGKTDIEVRHYGTKENTYHLYNDDGVSFNYEKGEYTLTELKVEKKKDRKLTGSSKSFNNKFNYGTITWRWMTR